MERGGFPTVSGYVLNRHFLGLAAMEFWERFAMSGLKSLLILILIDRIFSGNLSQVMGASTFRHGTETLFGPLSRTGLASQLYGYANALIYLSIPLGGLIGDLIGSRKAMVVSGGVGMLAGFLLMLDARTFLVGLLPFAMGAGMLKGNLSAEVGLLFKDNARRRQGYVIYLGFLNAGVICGPLVCGMLAMSAGWPYAIGAAALAIMIGLICYDAGGRSGDSGAATSGGQAPASEPQGRRRHGPPGVTALLVVALIAIYSCYSAYDQLSNMFLVWARGRIDLRLGGWTMPVAWFQSLDGLFTLLLIAGAGCGFRALERRGARLGDLSQILLGGIACAAGYLVLAIGDAWGGRAALPLPWALAYLLLVDSAVVLIWPSGLSLIAGVAPRRRVGFWMGLFYLHGFFASLWVGFSGACYGRIAPTPFWLIHAAIAGAGALMILLLGLPLSRLLHARQATTTSA